MPVYRFSIRAVTDSELSSQVPGAVSINASGPDVYIDVDALVGSFNDLNAFMQSKGFVYVSTDPVTTPSNAGSATINHSQLLNLSANDHPQYQLTSEKGAANGYAGLDASSLLALINLPGHASTHQNGGLDEISVAGLSGQLADAQKVTVRVNSGSDLGPQARLNFIAGTNVTLSGVNDGPNNEVDITINAISGGVTINSGIAELDFGSGGDNLELTITGQSGITPSSKIKAWISGTGTADHSSDEHAILSPYFQCITRNIVNGVGFDIVAVSQVQIAGRINVQWEWYN